MSVQLPCGCICFARLVAVTVLCCTLYYIVLYCTVLYCTVLSRTAVPTQPKCVLHQHLHPRSPAHHTCISSKHSNAASRSPLLLLLLPPFSQPLFGSGPDARMKLRAAADMTDALAAANLATGTRPARVALQCKQTLPISTHKIAGVPLCQRSLSLSPDSSPPPYPLVQPPHPPEVLAYGQHCRLGFLLLPLCIIKPSGHLLI
jgi:hypothetical protein